MIKLVLNCLYPRTHCNCRAAHERNELSSLHSQEKLTAQIANTINDVLKPQGVGVIIKAKHHCMTTRGIHKPDTDLVTSRMLGCFRDNPLTRQEFLTMVD